MMQDQNNQEEYISDYEISLPERVEVVIKALGTMIIMPEYETDDTTFRKKYAGGVQKPILEGEQRKIVEDKLVELINQL